MKDFDLEKAKAGNPVCTRDGRDVRILAFDLKDDIYPICAAITNDSHNENVIEFTKDGKFLIDQDRHHSDLMMKTIKQERYVNIYVTKDSICTVGATYSTKEQALANIDRLETGDDYVKTVKVEWEE